MWSRPTGGPAASAPPTSRADSVVLCEGQAVLIQGCDEVRGEAIRFDVDQEKVRVIGGASVLLQPEEPGLRGGDAMS